MSIPTTSATPASGENDVSDVESNVTVDVVSCDVSDDVDASSSDLKKGPFIKLIRRSNKPGMSSTLVETVSINYEDFNDSFLTCGTCLCQYDNMEHNPKLLPCSHTVCKNCLERIIESQTRDTGTFRCPICRETITIPRGGVPSFPPSFIVNQLLDLMASHRRDVIPKCSQHVSQELLFCESCDTVFCNVCTGGSHNGRGASQHTVIPFSIAIKRMSEILLYKAHLCIKNLNSAHEIVTDELQTLETNVETVMENVNKSFDDLITMVDRRRRDVLNQVKRIRDDKKRGLKEQLELIESEKSKVQNECEGLQYQVEVRNITKKISDLNEKLDALSLLAEPRENAFLKYEYRFNTALQGVQNCLNHFGRVRVSTTYPALCLVHIPATTVLHLSVTVQLTTVDYHGNPRTDGGDPLTAELRYVEGETESEETIPTKIVDNNNGTYGITFISSQPGRHKLTINIFDRPVKDSPYIINLTEHNNPVAKFGSRGVSDQQFIQPVNICIGKGEEEFVYVLDTGNSRIKCLDSNLNFVKHYDQNAGLEHQSGTGIALHPITGNIFTVNWRTRTVTEVDASTGEKVKSFSCQHFQEPINLCVNVKGDVIVADNGLGQLLHFNSDGKLLNRIGSKGDKPGQFKLISSVVCLNDGHSLLVADNRLQVFSFDGKFQKQLIQQGEPRRGQYGSVCVDSNGWVLATRTEKGRQGGIVQVFNNDYKFLFNIDSNENKLKRPSGLSTFGGHNENGARYVLVVDLGNDCVKKYRYR